MNVLGMSAGIHGLCVNVPIHDGNENILCGSGSGDGETICKIGGEGAREGGFGDTCDWLQQREEENRLSEATEVTIL